MKKPWIKLLVALAILEAVLWIAPLLITVPPLEGTVPPKELADPDSRFVTIDGLDVHYKMAGEGEPVFVLMHGFAASVFSWREVMDPLAEEGTAIAYDRPAFGLTERPIPGSWEGESPYGEPAQVDLVLDLMDAFKVERAILVGNSAGGRLALLTALQAPERVEALVLVDAAVYTKGRIPAWIRPLLFTPQMDRLGPLLTRRISSQGEEFASSAWHDPSRITPEIWAGYLKPLQAENWDKALFEVTREGFESGLPERLGTVRIPTLVITGEDDQVVPAEQSIRLAGELPDSELVVIPDCGHAPQEECPAPFMDALSNFVR